MTNPTEQNEYIIPSRWYGYETKQSALKWETNFYEAAKEMAAAESRRLGRTIAVSTLLMNKALLDPELKKRYETKVKLKIKGDQHDNPQGPPSA